MCDRFATKRSLISFSKSSVQGYNNWPMCMLTLWSSFTPLWSPYSSNLIADTRMLLKSAPSKQVYPCCGLPRRGHRGLVIWKALFELMLSGLNRPVVNIVYHRSFLESLCCLHHSTCCLQPVLLVA